MSWLRDQVINLLLDMLCQVLPADKTFQLTIEPVDGGASMLATLREVEKGQ